MSHVKCFNLMATFEQVDRFPPIEWAEYWRRTLTRWNKEVLPAELGGGAAIIREGPGLGPYRQVWNELWSSVPGKELTAKHFPLQSAAKYVGLLMCFFLGPPFNVDWRKTTSKRAWPGELAAWLLLHGFVRWPRNLFGIEVHVNLASTSNLCGKYRSMKTG